jgi:TolB-like protein
MMNKSGYLALTAIVYIFAFQALYAKDTPPRKDTVSILYFENTTRNQENAWLSKGIADMLISEIAGRGAIDVVERVNLKKILDEQQLSLTGLVDDKKAIELGKLLSANKLIYGSFIIKGETIIINGKLTETESGKITATFSTQGPLESILVLQNDLSIKVKKALGIETRPEMKTTPEHSIQAVKKYYQGLDLLDRGAVEDAKKKFEEASTIDPYYLKPYQGIEESYKYLKDFIKMRHQREIAGLYDKIIKIQNRLKEAPWRSFADIAADPYYAKLRRENQALYEKEVYAYYQGDTPAVCTWNLQNNLFELADLYSEYFNETGKAEALNKEIISITEKSRKAFAKDPFLPEILYAGLRAKVYLEDWREVKKRSEELMSNYPDYRMMWAIEDMYKKALEKLSKDKMGE